MPTRNWWLELDVDGRKHTVTGGPRAKDGGFSLQIFQRSDGASKKVLSVEGFVSESERLILDVSDELNGNVLVDIVTQR